MNILRIYTTENTTITLFHVKSIIYHCRYLLFPCLSIITSFTSLLTACTFNLEESLPEYNKVCHLLNCHLQAVPEGKRRLCQIDEGAKARVNLYKKMEEEDPKDPRLIFYINKTYATCATKSDESSLCLLDVKVTNVKDLER